MGGSSRIGIFDHYHTTLEIEFAPSKNQSSLIWRFVKRTNGAKTRNLWPERPDATTTHYKRESVTVTKLETIENPFGCDLFSLVT